MNPVDKTLWRVVLGLGLALIIAITLSILGWVRGDEIGSQLNTFAQTTCAIQKRSLPAGRELVSVFRAEASLLKDKPSAIQKKVEPPSTAKQLADLKSLTAHLDQFNKLIGNQPITVTCPKI